MNHKSLKRIISGVSSLAILTTSIGLSPIGVIAEDGASAPVTNIAASASAQITNSNSGYSIMTGSGTLNMRSDNGTYGTTAYMGALSFDLSELKTAVESGNEIESVKLVTYTERSKSENNKAISIKKMADGWESDAELIGEAQSGEPVSELTIASQSTGSNGAVFDFSKTGLESFIADEWRSEADVTALVSESVSEGTLDILLENGNQTVKEDQQIFSAVMSDSAYGTNDTNKTRVETMAQLFGLENNGEEYDWSSMRPQLIISYEELEKTAYSSASAQIRDGAVYSTSGSTVEVRRNTAAESGTKEFNAVIDFDMSGINAAVSSGHEIAKAELITYTERSKGSNKTLAVKPIAGDWQENAQSIADAAAAEKIGTITLNSQNNTNAVSDEMAGVEFDPSKWRNTSDITDYIKSVSGSTTVSLYFENESDGPTNQQCMFSSNDYTNSDATKVELVAGRFGITQTEGVYDWTPVKPQIVVTYTDDTEEPSEQPTSTPESTPESTEELTEEPTALPTAEPLPEGAIVVKDLVSNDASTQTIQVDAAGNTREAAYTTQDKYIWYIGNYDLSEIESIEMRLGLVKGTDSGTGEEIIPQVNIAYMPIDGTTIDAEYINTNSSEIRSANKKLVAVSGVTEPEADEANGHKYLGALFEADADGVRISANDTYSEYPGGTVTLNAESCQNLKLAAEGGEAALFIYAKASKCRAAIDYIVINKKSGQPEPTSTPTAVPTSTPTAEPTSTPTAVPTSTPTAEPTATPTAAPTSAPTAEPLPEGAITVKDQVSNVSSTQNITVDEYGNKRDAAVTTNDTSIWYLGNYDMETVSSIEMRIGLVKGTDSGTGSDVYPTVNIAYMPLDSEEINADYITANSSKIRSSSNKIASVSGVTEPSADPANGHKYLGALFELTDSGVKVSDKDTYGVYPGGNVTLVSENCMNVKRPSESGEVALFVYAKASKCRAAIDYVLIHQDREKPTATPSTSEDPDKTEPPTETAAPSGYPEGAIVIKDNANNTNDKTNPIKIDADGNKRNAAYSTDNNSVWYLGTYDVKAIENIQLRLGMVGTESSMPQVKLSYLPLDGSTIDDAYVSANNSTIRSTNNTIAVIEGLTLPSADPAKGHEYLGAMYTVDETGVRVNSEEYAVFPGGTASVGVGSQPLSIPKDAEGSEYGKVALFLYTTAQSRRVTIDYAIVTEKVLTPTELRIDGEDTWVIREGVDSDYETALDDYKAVLISDLGTEMQYDSSNVRWSVSGCDYISMKSPSGGSSIMTADKKIPVGKTYTITLKAEYDDGTTALSAEKQINAELREASVPTQMSMEGESRIELLNSQLPSASEYKVTLLDQFGAEMTSAVIDWSVEGEVTEGLSIENGVLTIGENAVSTIVTVKAASRTNPDACAEMEVSINISKYPSKLYPSADVLFRKGNTNATNVTGPDIEIRNVEDSDKGFVGALKFDLSTLREAVEEGYPINSVKIRLTTVISRNQNLIVKELSNDWDESSSTANSYDNKTDIINAALSSDAKIVNNEIDSQFTLSCVSSGKRIYEGERGDSETAESWQTVLDITDYVLGNGTEGDSNKNGWLADHPGENVLSLLVVPDYNGTNSNTFFSKDVGETYANWSALTTKFPEFAEDPSLLYPAVIVDYAQEKVTVTAKVNALPIPDTDTPNKTSLTAVHYDPFTETSDEDIAWSVSGFKDENGNTAAADGITIDNNGVLSVSRDAQPGTVTVRASAAGNKAVYSEIEIRVTKLAGQLANGSFENIDDAMMPIAWSSYDPDIEQSFNGTQRYEMDQASEPWLANFLRNNDTDGYVSGTHSAEDPIGVYGKKTVLMKAAHGIDKDYEGYIYTNNAAISSSDGGPHIRVTAGTTYWVLQDYHLHDFYQLNSSAVIGPYVGYEGYQGTTGKSSQFSGTWYIKDGSASAAYTTDGYDTLVKQITVPQNINRLRFNWGLKGSEGSIYFHNFRVSPQGIDTAKTPVDGEYELKVTNKMSWTSDGVTVSPGKKYSYKFSSVTDTQGSGIVKLTFFDAEGGEISTETIEAGTSAAWKETAGEVTAPANSAYASVTLCNGTSIGNVWYDNIIFTETSEPVATYIRITSGNDMVISPLDGETANNYTYTAAVTDQYNNAYSSEIVWTLDKSYKGISIRSNGSLVVTSEAEAGAVTIIAASSENSAVAASKTVSVVKKSSETGSVELVNGSFADYDSDTLEPSGWTQSDKKLSIANGTFDSSISGWKLNYTSYSTSDTSAAMEWDSSVDHTGNAGGSARIFNADRAQGSMQISDNLVITGGNTYDISVWVKTDHVSSDSNVYATLIFYDENGSTIEENKQMLVYYPKDNDGNGNNTSDWTKLSGSIYVNPLTAKLRIDMRYRGGANNQNGTVWFDDLTISKQAGIDAAESYNGLPALSITGYGVEDSDVTRTYGEKWDSTPVEGIIEGQEYVYSAAVKAFNAAEGGYLMVTFYDEQGRSLKSYKSDYVSGTSSDWTTVTASAAAPADSAYAIMSLCIDGKGTVWFADASFETKTDPEAKSIIINGSDTVSIPGTEYYKAAVVDQYGITIDTIDIPLAAEYPSGVTFDGETGKLTVSAAAQENQKITITAEYSGLTASKTVTTLAGTTSISIDGADNVIISSSKAKTSTYSVLNQLAQKINSQEVAWSVSGKNVSIKDGVLTVDAGAPVQTITITAEYDGFKASKKVSLTNTSTSTGSGSTGGGGGGGGGAVSGGSSSGTTTGTDGSAMGNFSTGSTAGSTDSTTEETVNGEQIIPQPDPTYFTQNMDNIGGFKDIGSVKWAQEAIVAMSAVGIVNGKEDGYFYPNDNVTRAEFVKMLVGTLTYAERIDTSDTGCSFADVAADAWYHDSVAIAVNNGIVQGISDTEFAPDAKITRQDIAVMVERAAKAANIQLSSGAELIFTDENDISDYALESVKAMAKAGIINGYEDGTFLPLTNATRAQAVVIIYRMAGGE